MNNPSWSSALSASLALLPTPRSERVSRREALGRLLLEPLVVDRDYPIGHLSMMDGYAITKHLGQSYRVVGENRPGEGPGLPLQPGEARRIFTGAELPENGVRVIPQESIRMEEDRLQIESVPEPVFVRLRGSEASKGSRILEPGIRISPVEQAIMATIGVTHVEVAARPRISHIATGSELVDPDSASPGSMTRDSNSDLVAASLRTASYPLVAQSRVDDSRDLLLQSVEKVSQECDLLLISGGASVGAHDHTRTALEAAGFRMETHGIDVRPGKPVGLARRENQWAVALPGNPVSHLVALHLFVLPILRGLEGEKFPEPKFLHGILQESPSADVPRRPTFWPTIARLVNGVFHLHPRRFLSSGDLLGIAQANSLVFFPAGAPLPPLGAEVSFLPLTFHSTAYAP